MWADVECMGTHGVHMYEIRATWDADAGVWWAESDDVPGLVAESATVEGLVEDLRHLVPELLRLNGISASGPAMFRLKAERQEEACLA